MLPLRRERAVAGDDSPLIPQGAAGLAAGIEDGLNRQGHARTQGDVRELVGAEIEHGRFFVQVPADTVAGVILHNTETVGFDVVFNGSSDIQQGVACFDLAQTSHQGFLGNTAQGLCFLGCISHADRDAAVAVVALEIGAGIHLQQIALADHTLRTGDAMHHFVVDAGADARRKTVIALETWGRPHFADALFRIGINISRCLAGLHHSHHLPQHGGDDVAGLAHDLHFTG